MCCTLAKYLFIPFYAAHFENTLRREGKTTLLSKISEQKCHFLGANFLVNIAVIARFSIFIPDLDCLSAPLTFVATLCTLAGAIEMFLFCKNLYGILNRA